MEKMAETKLGRDICHVKQSIQVRRYNPISRYYNLE